MDKVDQWLMDKRGRFSASLVSKLLTKSKNGDMFSDGAKTYIMETAVQMVTKVWDQGRVGDHLEPMLHGKVHEYPAYVHYIQETKNFSVKYFGEEHPIFIEWPEMPDEFGCSPDGGVITDEGTVPLGIEIKCPFNSLLHIERSLWKDQWDILTYYPTCYAQIQASLMCTGADEWHFISYDERHKSKRLRIKIIPVLADIKFQDNMRVRIKQAVSEKYKFLSKHLGIEVHNRSEFTQKFQSFL